MKTVALQDLVKVYGEDAVKRILKTFSCKEKNEDVDRFLRKLAIKNTRKRNSITHLVFDDERRLVAYFTLTNKPLTIRLGDFSDKDVISRLDEVARVTVDRENRIYRISAYLIAQVAKNQAIPEGRNLSGRDLFAEIFSKIAIVQGIVGGKVVFLEYEKERPQLRKLYTQKYGFREFPMPSNEDKQRKLGQLFCFLNDDVERNEPKVD